VEPDVTPATSSSVELPPTRAVAAVAALGDEFRRRMYEFIRGSADPVTRDQAAAEVGISRKLAAFHLDKLVDVGLLRVEVAAPGEVRRIGRRPKVYRASDAHVDVSIPARRPDLLADLLLDALGATDEVGPEAADGAPDTAVAASSSTDRVAAVARRRGFQLGAAERARTRPGRLGSERGLTAVDAALAALGFEPRRERATELSLRNCPFQPHAAAAPQLVCTLNHALITGLLEGLEAATITATLAPQPGTCCVRLTG
jgi:predicted ArsR family transcriptional regulator